MVAEYLSARVSLHWTLRSPLILALNCEKSEFRLSIIKSCLEVLYKQSSKYALCNVYCTTVAKCFTADEP